MSKGIPRGLQIPPYVRDSLPTLCPWGESIKGVDPVTLAYFQRRGEAGGQKEREYWWAGPYKVFRSIYMAIFEK